MDRSITFVIDGDVDTQITVTEIDGSLRFDITVLGTGSLGDLRALFVDLEGYEAGDSLSVAGEDVTGSAFDEASVDTVGGDANVKGEVVNELGAFDLGVAFGSPGIGEDDIQETSFTLSSETGPLTLDMLSLADIALRYTNGGAKIGGTIPEVEPPAPEEPTFDNEFSGTDGVNLFQGFVDDTQVDGLGGDDVLTGDYQEIFLAAKGPSTFLNQSGNVDTLSAGDDLISAGSGSDIVRGDVNRFEITSDFTSPVNGDLLFEAGNDTLSGGEGADTLYGDIQFIATLTSEPVSWTVIMGDDIVDGDGGDDQLVGDAALALDVLVQPTEIRMGSDVLRGGDGNDTIVGDVEASDGFTDVQNLTGGNDTIVGGAGNDTLFGDADGPAPNMAPGADVFVFETGSGLDTIMDFDATDLIDISAYGFTDIAQLTIETNATDAVIDLDGTAMDVDEITVAGASAGLDAGSFIFA